MINSSHHQCRVGEALPPNYFNPPSFIYKDETKIVKYVIAYSMSIPQYYYRGWLGDEWQRVLAEDSPLKDTIKL